MSYVDRSRRSSPALIVAVGGLHLAIGYALLSGLAYNVVKHFQAPPIIVQVPPEAPPPPPRVQPATPRAHLVAPTIPAPLPHPVQIEQPPLLIPMPALDPGVTSGGTGTLPPADLPTPSQARGAAPATNRAHWITPQDYPAAALRQEIEGVVVISALIGTDGRVRSCLVTQSSGSPLLDDTTCRLYTARARFTPALDDDGRPTTAQRTDRFRWQIPHE